MQSLLSSVALAFALTLAASTVEAASEASVRFLDLNGDGLLDQLISEGSGLSVAISNGEGTFDPTAQQLPAVELSDVLVSDLDGDGLADLYIVSPGDNLALRGDGTGRFTDATQALGLADAGHGLSATLVKVDNDGAEELLLHNVDGDVLFWSTGYGFERDVSTPVQPSHSSDADSGLAALEQLVAEAAELLALDPGEELVLGLDGDGQPRVRLGSQLASTSAGLLGGDAVGATVASAGPNVVGGKTPPPAIAVLTSDEQDILDTMSIVMLDDGAGNLVNKTVRFTGVNLQVVNGLGATNGNTNNPTTINPANTTVNGVGNLLVGYNELGNTLGDARTGSHNVVLGQTNSYPTFGGFLGGRNNTISGVFASVSGGEKNNAKARLGSISGGKSNTVKGSFTSISGGTFNTAIGQNASISGGRGNKASGVSSSVSGGGRNTASGTDSSISGGGNSQASGPYSSVSGGYYNVASGKFANVSCGFLNTSSSYYSSVSGGYNNTASGVISSVSGGYNNTASGFSASVSGGRYNVASGTYSSVSGGYGNAASGETSSVSGGGSRTAANTDDWVAGSLFEDN